MFLLVSLLELNYEVEDHKYWLQNICLTQGHNTAIYIVGIELTQREIVL